MLLRIGSRGSAVKELQGNLISLGYNPKGVDGIFGIGTLTATKQFQKDNKLVVDGVFGPASFFKLNELLKPTSKYNNSYYRFKNAHVLEVDPLSIFVEVVKKQGNQINGDFINGTLFGTYKGQFVSISTLVNDGKVIAEQLQHDNVKRGTLVVYKDGRVTVEMIDFISKHKELQSIKCSIGGFNILPDISIREQFKKEWFNYETVGYRTWRSMIGYNKSKNKLLIVIAPYADAQEGSNLLKQLGCDIGIGLDSGGSTCGRFEGKTIRTTTRKIHNIIRWR